MTHVAEEEPAKTLPPSELTGTGHFLDNDAHLKKHKVKVIV